MQDQKGRERSVAKMNFLQSQLAPFFSYPELHIVGALAFIIQKQYFIELHFERCDLYVWSNSIEPPHPLKIYLCASVRYTLIVTCSVLDCSVDANALWQMAGHCRWWRTSEYDILGSRVLSDSWRNAPVVGIHLAALIRAAFIQNNIYMPVAG